MHLAASAEDDCVRVASMRPDFVSTSSNHAKDNGVRGTGMPAYSPMPYQLLHSAPKTIKMTRKARACSLGHLYSHERHPR
jgi:hypothetical protein